MWHKATEGNEKESENKKDSGWGQEEDDNP